MIKSVIIPLERALNGVPGMKYMTSDAEMMVKTSIQVVFNLGTDPNQAAINVQNRVLQSLINSSISGKRGVKITREVPSMLMYVNLLVRIKIPIKVFVQLCRYQCLSELKRVNGVGSGDILGTREYAMRIWLKPDRMLAYKISTDEVMEALSSQSLEASPGKTGKPLVSVHKHLNMYLIFRSVYNRKAICKYNIAF
jgi:HAE1 family hydrophobic/amphiphilic exporter-1